MYCTRNVTADLVWVGADDRRLACFEGVYGVPDVPCRWLWDAGT